MEHPWSKPPLRGLRKRLAEVAASVDQISTRSQIALAESYDTVITGLAEPTVLDRWHSQTWKDWFLGKQARPRTVLDDVMGLLSHTNSDGTPNYDAIAAMQMEVLAYDRAPAWKRAWMSLRGQGVERKRATLLGCQVQMHRRFAGSSYKAFRHYSAKIKSLPLPFSDEMPKDPFDNQAWNFEQQTSKLSWVYGAVKSACTDFYHFMRGDSPEMQAKKVASAHDVTGDLRRKEESIKHALKYGPEKSVKEIVREGATRIIAAFAPIVEERRALREAMIKAHEAHKAALKPFQDVMTSRLDEAVAFCQNLPGSTFILTEARQALLDDLKQRIARAYNEQELAEIYESEPYQSVMKDWVPAEAAHILQGRLQDLTAARGGPARGFADTDVMRRAMGLAEGAAAAPEDSAPSAVM